MIRTVVIDGFKSIGEQLTLELGRVNVFIGANGAGKSALLEAIGVLGAAASGRVDDSSLMRRGVRPGVPALYKSSFKGRRHRTTISLKAEWAENGETSSYGVGLDNPIDRPEPAWRFRTESTMCARQRAAAYSRSPASRQLPVDEYTSLASRGPGTVGFPPTATRLLNALKDYAIFCPTTPVLRGTDPDGWQRPPVGLAGGRLAEAFMDLIRLHRQDYEVSLLRQFIALIDWVQGMGVRASPPTSSTLSPSVPSSGLTVTFVDRFMREGRNRLMAYDASEGALYVLFLAVLALHPNAPLAFAVDNFDHAMNPRLARAVTRLFCQCLAHAAPTRQALLTTHNPLVLDGLDLRNDDIRLFTVDRKRNGMTFVKRVTVDPDLLTDAEKPGMSLSRLWIMGRLGGMPNV